MQGRALLVVAGVQGRAVLEEEGHEGGVAGLAVVGVGVGVGVGVLGG